MRVYSQIKTPCTVAKLESLCIQAAHAGHAQAHVIVKNGFIQVTLSEGEKHEHAKEQGQTGH